MSLFLIIKGRQSSYSATTKNLMGSADNYSPMGDIATLISTYRLDSFQAQALAAPFTKPETNTVVFSMKLYSAPGPDGFGPQFYQTNWSLVKGKLLEFMTAWHQSDIVLQGVNKSFMVHLQKIYAVQHPKDFPSHSRIACLSSQPDARLPNSSALFNRWFMLNT